MIQNDLMNDNMGLLQDIKKQTKIINYKANCLLNGPGNNQFIP